MNQACAEESNIKADRSSALNLRAHWMLLKLPFPQATALREMTDDFTEPKDKPAKLNNYL